MDEMEELEEPRPKTWTDKYGYWLVLLFVIGLCLIGAHFGPFPDWVFWVVFAAVMCPLIYFSFIKKKYPD